jgi:hypothetical protein
MHGRMLTASHPARVAPIQATYWALRVGAALCFIGHGAFGFITKAAWLPYFAVVGVPESIAWRLMPLVGTVDVVAGFAVLFAPRGLPLAYMTCWAAWTALLRPLAGEPVFETLERAGNYGVPLAMLVLGGMPRAWRDLLRPLEAPTNDPDRLARVRRILTWTTALLLFGHGALGAITGKGMLTEHYAAIGLAASTTAIVGWLEIAAALLVLVRPSVVLLLGVATWKVATEWLFVVSGAPIWEWVERFGSYTAPLALAALLVATRSSGDRAARDGAG